VRIFKKGFIFVDFLKIIATNVAITIRANTWQIREITFQNTENKN